MKLLRYPAPPALIGDNLQAEVETALGLAADAAAVALVTDRVEILVPSDADESVVASVVAAHTGLPTPEQQAEVDADDEAASAFGDLGPLLAKARAVRAGTDTFTAAQLQRIVAGLVLLAARRLR